MVRRVSVFAVTCFITFHLGLNLILHVHSLEWWSFVLLVLLSVLLANPKLEASVLSICLNTIALTFMIPFGLGAAISMSVNFTLKILIAAWGMYLIFQTEMEEKMTELLRKF
ncbi:MATE efflux family protein 9 [Hordeum vulgare]|nr:MATE efflux family protein 9 [Hordeum vulgare]